MAEPAPQQTDQQRARDELVSARDASDSISVLPTPDEVDAETAAVVTEISRDLAGQLGMNIEVKEDEFVCPISTDVLKDPVWADDGILYEREQIEQYFASAAYQDQRRSPITRRVMGIQLTPDVMLRAALLSHKMQQECMFGAGAECPVPVSMQCAVQALSQFRMAIGRSVDVTPERVLKELMEIDEKLAISDRATAAGFTDAHIRGYLHQHGVQFFEVNQQQFRANRDYLQNMPAVFNTGRHWAADQRTMPQAVLIFFFGDLPAEVNLVDPLDNPGGDEGNNCEECDQPGTNGMNPQPDGTFEYFYCDDHYEIVGACGVCGIDLHPSWDIHHYPSADGGSRYYCRPCGRNGDPLSPDGIGPAPLFFCLLFVCFVNACLFVRQVESALLLLL